MRIFPLLGWMLVPGCWALTGPEAVRGPAGGSVSVRCGYDEGYERYPKFWCRGEWFWRACSYSPIAESAGTEAEVRRGRVSLRDDHTNRTFTVTLENLTAADAGTYQCGINIPGLVLSHIVEVTVLPAIRTSTPTERLPATAEQPGDAASTPITLSVRSNNTHSLAQLSNIHFLLLVIWKVPVFLCIVGMNVWYGKNSRERPGRQ